MFNGKNIGFIHRMGIDTLMGLHLRQGGNSVAIHGGRFKIQRLGGLLHLPGKLGLNVGTFALEKTLRILHQLGVILGGYFSGTRSGTTLDLIK